ncbi:MAG TPA: rhomboid family intramembrane serine protease [Saprospiraceae bacterium]|nr:rhomboid family intramembrane serine protease [Saprospiraceae bacterium]
MIRTIKDDLNQVFSAGSMVTKLIVANVIIYIFFLLLYITFINLSPSTYQWILNILRIPGEIISFLKKPWTMLTYMFSHEGFWHLLWNMVGLNVFGRIVGDLLGDKRILPIYIIGGLGAAAMFLLWANFPPSVQNSHAIGASGSIMALAAVAVIIAPDYQIRLLLLGNVKLIYIVIAFVLFDFVGIASQSNTGGHWGHIGGLLTGFFIIYGIKRGVDSTEGLNKVFDKVENLVNTTSGRTTKRSKLRVEYRSKKMSIDMFKPYALSPREMEDIKTGKELNDEEELNRILEKIKNVGYDNLTNKEKSFLKKMSEN